MSNIKIKSIEIEAFRGYENKVNFDFTDQNGVNAKFIAIYAPNGFGKTSFFDAVEWSIKQKIERFDDDIIMQKSAEYGGGDILKNRNSPLASGRIKIIDEKGLDLERLTKKSQKWDLLPGTIKSSSTSSLKSKIKSFSRNNLIEILPQSRIDNFISSKKPTERYKALMDFWGGKEDSAYYRGIFKIDDELKKKIEILEKTDKKLIQSEIEKYSPSEEKLLRLNEIINNINHSKFQKLSLELITKKTSAKDSDKLQEEINHYLPIVENELTIQDDIKNQTGVLKENFSIYNSRKKNLGGKNKLLSQKQGEVADFKQLEGLLKSKDVLEQELVKANSNKRIILNIHEKQSIFNKSNNDLGKLQETKQKLLEYSSKAKNCRGSLELGKINHNKLIESNKLKINVNTELLVGFDSNFEKFSNNKKSIIHFNNRIALSDKIRRIRERVILKLEDEVAELNVILDENKISYITNDSSLVKHQKKNNLIITLHNEKKVFEDDLAKKRVTYNDTEVFEDSVKKLIDLGKKVILEKKDEICPLCSKSHDDFDSLLKVVESQKSSSSVIEILSKEIDQCKSEINSKSKLIEDALVDLKKDINNEKDAILLKITILERKLQQLASFDRYYSNKRDTYYNENQSILNQYKLEAFEKEQLDSLKVGITRKLSLAKEIFESSTKRIIEIDNVLVSIDEKLINTDSLIQNIIDEHKSITNNSVFTEVQSYLINNNISVENYVKNSLKSELSSAKSKISDIKLRIKIDFILIPDLKEKIKNLNRSNIERDIIELETFIKRLIDFCENYENRYKKIINSSVSDCIAELNNKDLEISQSISHYTNLIQKLKELSNNIEDIRSNITLNEKRAALDVLVSKINHLRKLRTNLKIVKDKASSLIKVKMNSIFNGELIQDIYSKIDPHPQYKSVILEPSFNSADPELQIKAISNDGLDVIDPTLYHSSAQINILSLSIFLAKALQNGNSLINTIFMDDPIQHLDSINVLSFIDLLRSITTDPNIDRQIVISTHDENFFRLLKRKFDPDFYSSKFIEFESYGKLK